MRKYTPVASIPVTPAPAPVKQLPPFYWVVVCEWEIYHRRRCIEFRTEAEMDAWIEERFNETGPGCYFKLIDIYKRITETQSA